METSTQEIKSQLNGRAAELKGEAKKAVSAIKESPAAERFLDGYHEVKERAVEAYDSSIDLVRRNPVASIATAVAVGVVAGMLLKRSK